MKWAIRSNKGLWFSQIDGGMTARWCWVWDRNSRVLFDGAYQAENIVRYLNMPVGTEIVSVDPKEKEPEVSDPAEQQSAA